MGVWHRVTPQAYTALSLQRCVCRVSSVRRGQNVGFGLRPKAEARATPRLTGRMVAGVPIIVSWACMSWPPCSWPKPTLVRACAHHQQNDDMHTRKNCRALLTRELYSSLGLTCGPCVSSGRAGTPTQFKLISGLHPSPTLCHPDILVTTYNTLHYLNTLH